MTKKTQANTKEKIQYLDAKITCSCGEVYNVGSTVAEMSVEICAACHPFYTGTQKFVDTAGRLERFQAKVEAAKVHKAATEKKKQSKADKKAKEVEEVEVKTEVEKPEPEQKVENLEQSPKVEDLESNRKVKDLEQSRKETDAITNS